MNLKEIFMGSYMGFQALTALVIQKYIRWNVMTCSPIKVGGRFGGTFLYIPEDMAARTLHIYDTTRRVTEGLKEGKRDTIEK
jgi:hypothetical protein